MSIPRLSSGSQGSSPGLLWHVRTRLDHSTTAAYGPRPFPIGPEFPHLPLPRNGTEPLARNLDMPKPTKVELAKYKDVLRQQLAVLRGDVGSMKDEALRASEQDASVDHLADQGTDNYDQGFMLGLIENEEETITLMVEALERANGNGEYPYGQCSLCGEEASEARTSKAKGRKRKTDPWIAKARLAYIPWARYCVRHQSEVERSRESA